MAYSQTSIVNIGTTWYNMRAHLTRDSNGRLYAMYPDSGANVWYTKHSDDDGATWSAAKQVGSWGASGGSHGATIKMGLDDSPVALLYKDLGNNSLFYAYKYNTTTEAWVYQGQSLAPWGSSEPKPYGACAMCQSSGGRWYVAMGGGTTTWAGIYIQYSDDDGATWTSITAPAAGGSSSPAFRITRNNLLIDLVMDENDTLHIAFQDMDGGVSNKHDAFYYSADASNDPASLTWSSVKKFVTPAAFSANDLGFLMFLAIDSNLDVHMIWERYQVAGNGASIETIYAKKTSGVWGSEVVVDSGNTNRPYCAGLVGDVPYFYGPSSNGGGYVSPTQTWKYNATDGTGATWNGPTNVDVDTANSMGSWGQFTSGLDHTRLAGGEAFLFWNSNDGNLYYVRDNPVWQTQGGGDPYSEDTLLFTEEAEIQEQFQSEIYQFSTNTNTYGGRQVVRQADGRIWVFFRLGSTTGSFRGSYSDDGGRTWTATTIETSKNFVTGWAACIDENDRPLVVVSFNDKLRQYTWDGSSWTHVGNVSTGVYTTRGFQVLYDGSEYWLIYGDRASSGKRRVRYRKTSDPAVLFGSATNIVTSSAGSSKGAEYQRGMAAMTSGSDIHLVYQLKLSGQNSLRYTMWNGSTWSTPVAILDGKTGNNDIDVVQYVSMAMQSDGTIHVACARYGGTYPNRLAIWHVTNGSGSWVAQEVSGIEDRTQGGPSITVEEDGDVHIFYQWYSTSPIKYVTSKDGWATVKDKFDEFTDPEDPQLLHGPANVNYQRLFRGWHMAFAGSMEYAWSIDSVFDDEANATDDLQFTEVPYLQGFPDAQEILEFTEVASGQGMKSAADVLEFQEWAGLHYDIDADDTILFIEIPNRSTGEPVFDFLQFVEAAAGEKRPDREAVDTLRFLELVGTEFAPVCVDTLEFEEEASETARANVTVTDLLEFIEAPAEVADLGVIVADGLVFTEGAAVLPTGDPCDQYDPSPSIPTDEDSVQYVYFMGPWDTLEYVLRLKKPEYGDARNLELQVQVQRTRSGERRTHVRTPSYEPWEMEWDGLTREHLFEVRDFLLNTKGQEIRYIDHNGHVWRGVIINGSVPLNTVRRDQGTNFVLTFEGDLISA